MPCIHTVQQVCNTLTTQNCVQEETLVSTQLKLSSELLPLLLLLLLLLRSDLFNRPILLEIPPG